MRKVLSLILALTMILTLSACGGAPARQLNEYEQKVLDLTTRMAASTSTLLDAEKCEREFVKEYRTLYGKDPDNKSLLYGSKIAYDALGNSWDDMVREYQGIVVAYEALQKASPAGTENASALVQNLQIMYRNYSSVYDYVVHRTGSADRLITNVEVVLDAAKAIQDLLA